MKEIVIKAIEGIKNQTGIMIEKDMIGEAVVLSEKQKEIEITVIVIMRVDQDRVIILDKRGEAITLIN